MEDLLNLKRLDISYNNIDPEKLFLPPNLERLILGSGLKEGNDCITFPEVILALEHLEYLDMSTCGLQEASSDLGNLKSLKEISFLGNQIDELPSTLGQLTQLKVLILSYNDLRVLPREILSLDLDLLDVSGNKSFLIKGGGLGLGLLEIRQRFFVTWDVFWKTFYISDQFDAVEGEKSFLDLEVLQGAGKNPEKIAWPNAGEDYANFISGLDEGQAVLQIAFFMARECESFLPENERLDDVALLDHCAYRLDQDKLRSVGDEALIRGLREALWYDANNFFYELKKQVDGKIFRYGWTEEAVVGVQNFQQVENMIPHDLMCPVVRTGKRSADDLSMPGPSKVARLD